MKSFLPRRRQDKDGEWERHLAENAKKKLVPSPAAEAKALVVRMMRRAEQEVADYRDKRRRKSMSKIAKKRAKTLIETSKKDGKRVAEINEKNHARDNDTVMRRGYGCKHAMEYLDNCFKVYRSKPPAMITSDEDPTDRFMKTIMERIGQWSQANQLGIIETMSVIPPPKEEKKILHAIKRILTEVFVAQSNKTGPSYNARWRMWPHRRDEQEKTADPETKTTESDDMASKMAVNKKVSRKKASAKAAKKTSSKKSDGRSGALGDDSVLIRKAAKTDESALWTKFLGAMGAKATTFKQLCVTMKKELKMDAKKVRRITLSLRRRKLVATQE